MTVPFSRPVKERYVRLVLEAVEEIEREEQP